MITYKKMKFYIPLCSLTIGTVLLSCGGGSSMRLAHYGRQCSVTELPFDLQMHQRPTSNPPDLITLEPDNSNKGIIRSRPSGTYVFSGATIHYIKDLDDESQKNVHIIISQEKHKSYKQPRVWVSRVKCIRNARSLIDQFKEGKGLPIQISGLTRFHQPYEDEEDLKASEIKYNRYNLVFEPDSNSDTEGKLFFMKSYELGSDDSGRLKSIYEKDGLIPAQEVVFYEFLSKARDNSVSYQLRSKYQISPSETVYLAINLVRCVEPSQRDIWEGLSEEKKKGLVEAYGECLKELEVKNN